MGRREDALAAVTEAVGLYRALASQHPVFVPDVARSLVLQGLRHAESGDFVDAVSADREAVSVYTALVSADPDQYRDMYEEAIRSLAAHLKELGRNRTGDS